MFEHLGASSLATDETLVRDVCTTLCTTSNLSCPGCVPTRSVDRRRKWCDQESEWETGGILHRS